MMPEIAMAAGGSSRTSGSSDTAKFVSEQEEAGRKILQNSLSVGLGSTFNELCEVAEERSGKNWDGYGAEPISDDAYRFAYLFLESLPIGTSPPSIGAESDGDLTLEWYSDPRQTVSVSVSKDGDLHYAGLFGASKAYGTEPFFGEIPSPILSLIKRIRIK